MVIKTLRMCVEVVKLAVQFVVVVVEAMGTVMHQTSSLAVGTGAGSVSYLVVPYVGVLP